MFGVSATVLGNNDNNNNNNNITTSVRAADGGATVAAPAAEAQESGGTSGGSCSDAAPVGLFLMSEEGDKTGGGGNRWPQQETLALLKIRSEMDLAFRDSSLKGPLWENVSRKMAEFGYQRNAKKCKEKFENVYKYHKRTKEGRSSKTDGKTYRFFDQLQALENIGGAPPPPPPMSSVQLPPPPARPSQQTMPAAVTMAVPIQVNEATPSPTTQILSPQHQLTVLSTPQNTNTVCFDNPFSTSFLQPSQSPHPPPQPPAEVTGNAVVPPSFLSNSPSLSSSSTSSDEGIERRQKGKRKYKELFESLMQTVMEKQEAFQKKFLETLDKREKGRMMREEAWRIQEMARLKNEQDLLVQERSMAAARESALISLLQKMSENKQNPKNLNDAIGLSFSAAVQLPEKLPLPPTPNPPPAPAVVKKSTPPPAHVLEPPPLLTPVNNAPQPVRVVDNLPRQDNNGGGSDPHNTSSSATSSRWPKAEIDALINLRTHLDNKYQENGPKGPLWEEISGEMKKIGYNRNAKRCKEKWENINKYFKKVKESSKKRPEDSKTCPYYHQLDALYREKEKSGKPEYPMMSIMARPEQQWPFPQEQQQETVHQVEAQQQQRKQLQAAMEEQEGENNDDEEYDDEDDDGDDEEDEGSAYEIVSNKQPSSVTSTAA